jgi:predicted kinase
VPEPDLAPRVAAGLWEQRAPDPRPPAARPLLVVMAGVPLGGKSTLARALAAASPAAAMHVENDVVRVAVAAALRRAQPAHDGVEHFLTYRASWALAELALRNGLHAVHDATNLTESQRRGAYRAAAAAGAEVAVVFVLAAPEVLAQRASGLAPDRQLAHAKLGAKVPRPEASLPFVAVDGAAPLAPSLAALRAAAALAPLFLTRAG